MVHKIRAFIENWKRILKGMEFCPISTLSFGLQKSKGYVPFGTSTRKVHSVLFLGHRMAVSENLVRVSITGVLSFYQAEKSLP